MAFAILRTAKLKTAGNIGGLNSHLQRTRPTPNADPELTHENEILRGSTDLQADVDARLNELDGPRRKNAVLAVEHLITFSPDFVQFYKDRVDDIDEYEGPETHGLFPKTDVDRERLWGFIEHAQAWLDKRYGAENVVNVQLHLDESTPHIHATVVPVDEHGKLNCRALLGGREKMQDMQDSFGEEMAPLGLVRGVKGSKAHHQEVKRFYALAEELTPGLAAETIQARLQASDKDRQKDLHPPLVAHIHLHEERMVEDVLKALDKLNVDVLATDPPNGMIKVQYSPESDQIEGIHHLFGHIKKNDNHVEESGADFNQRKSRVRGLELAREQELDGPSLGD